MLRKGWECVADDERHHMVGHINPHCTKCGKTAMELARQRRTICRRATLPFDEPLTLLPAPAQRPQTMKDRAS
jgi:hypothetical protein